LHSHRAANQDGFDVEAFFTPEAFSWATLKGSSETEIPVVENLIFFNCADIGDTPISKKRITRTGIDLIRISTPLDGGGLFTTEPERGKAATKGEKQDSPQRPGVHRVFILKLPPPRPQRFGGDIFGPLFITETQRG
jgi:hypothetical protein